MMFPVKRNAKKSNLYKLDGITDDNNDENIMTRILI